MEVAIVIPGHGPVCGKEEIFTYAKFFEDMCSVIKRLVEDGAKEKDVMRYESFPEFYTEYRNGVRELALASWYKFYKKKCTSENFDLST